MKSEIRNLRLSQETVRILTSNQSRTAGGNAMAGSTVPTCPTTSVIPGKRAIH